MRKVVTGVVAILAAVALPAQLNAASPLDLGGPVPRSVVVQAPGKGPTLVLPRVPDQIVKTRAGMRMMTSALLFDIGTPSGIKVLGSGGSGGASFDATGDQDVTGTWTFQDSKFSIVDEGDATKKFAVSTGGKTTGTTTTLSFSGGAQTVTFPTGNVTLVTLETANQQFASNFATTSNFGFFLGGTGGGQNGISFQTAGTPDQTGLWTGTTSNAWLIAEVADRTFDFAHALQTNPTLFIHSANQSTSEWVSLSHLGASGPALIGVGNMTNGLVIGTSQTVNELTVWSGGVETAAGNVYGWSNSATNSYAVPDTGLARNSAGVIAATTSGAAIRGFLGGGAAVASATALPVPTGRVFHVTGTTTVTSITSTNFESGACITIIFDGILTFTDGSNLKLAGDFVTTADDTISLCYDGTNWYETARSVN